MACSGMENIIFIKILCVGNIYPVGVKFILCGKIAPPPPL